MPAPQRILDVGSVAKPGYDRRTRQMAAVAAGAKIVEIGASYNPLAPRSMGYTSFTIDHASRADLVAYYQALGVPTEKIEEVDFICADGNYDRVVPPEHLGTFDVCLSSHNIEHFPNPIRSLQSISALLAPGGVAALTVPDRRGCFDFFRPLTTTGAWVEAYLDQAKRHRLQTLFDMDTLPVSLGGVVVWHQDTPHTGFAFAGKDVLTSLRGLEGSDMAYRDAHASIFTPSSFLLLIYDAHAMGLTDLLPVQVDSDGGVEFFVELARVEQSPIQPSERLALLRRIGLEQLESFQRLL